MIYLLLVVVRIASEAGDALEVIEAADVLHSESLSHRAKVPQGHSGHLTHLQTHTPWERSHTHRHGISGSPAVRVEH
jgi:hypothetical protein